MDSQRNLVLIALLFVTVLLWQAWEKDHSPQLAQAAQQTVSQNSNTIDVTENNHQQINASNLPVNEQTSNKLITVHSDVLSLVINAQGGDIENAKLTNYTKTLKSNDPLDLLVTQPDFIYVAQSGLTGKDGPDNPNRFSTRPVYHVAQNDFTLQEGQNELRVPLTFTDPINGATYTKTFILTRGEYNVRVEYHVDNPTQAPLQLTLFGQLKQSIELPSHEATSGFKGFSTHTYRGAAYSSSDHKYKKYKFDTIKDEKPIDRLNVITKGGWVAMIQQYFVTAWIPSLEGENHFYTNYLGNDNAAIGFKNTVSVAADSSKTFGATLWVGPELQSKMAALAPNLDLTVDYGWLWFISQPLFKLLKWLHSFIGNWGASVIVITFIVRGIMYPLTRAQYTSMAKMRLLQPKIQAMRERLGEDRQKVSQEMMALYKREKVNPLGGCLPMIIQMPIFLALYYMLMGSVELRHAPFAFWIHDLSAQDPYYILPILMGITMFFIQKLSPTPTADPMQQKLMKFMPIIFMLFFLWFPSGLVLYYIVSNLVTIIQQQLIYRGLEKRGLHSRTKKS